MATSDILGIIVVSGSWIRNFLGDHLIHFTFLVLYIVKETFNSRSEMAGLFDPYQRHQQGVGLYSVINESKVLTLFGVMHGYQKWRGPAFQMGGP